MSVDLFSFKELYDVYLKATYPIEIGNKNFEVGEIIAKFDKIQIAGLDEMRQVVAARGGFDNRARVFWDTTKEIHLNFSQGVFSKLHFALLTNSRLLELGKDNSILITKSEEKESDENGHITLEKTPKGNLFIYEKESGDKITDFGIVNNLITLNNRPYKEVVVEYQYEYNENTQIVRIGRRLTDGFLELEAKTRVKDDTTGQTVTGLIKIPKLKFMAVLSIRLGAQANPVVANFSAVGVPVGSKGTSYVSDFYFLSNDIDSDI